jgi:hypothetical protein
MLVLGLTQKIMTLEERSKQVSEWLKRNVKTYETPSEITLFNFSVDAVEYEGRFSIKLDDLQVEGDFNFGLSGNGKPEIYFPIFHSPMGAPASYSAVELTHETKSAILGALAEVLPKVKPFGLNKTTGEWVLHTTHKLKDRIIDKVAYNQQFEAISGPEYSVVRKISGKQAT